MELVKNHVFTIHKSTLDRIFPSSGHECARDDFANNVMGDLDDGIEFESLFLRENDCYIFSTDKFVNWGETINLLEDFKSYACNYGVTDFVGNNPRCVVYVVSEADNVTQIIKKLRADGCEAVKFFLRKHGHAVAHLAVSHSKGFKQIERVMTNVLAEEKLIKKVTTKIKEEKLLDCLKGPQPPEKDSKVQIMKDTAISTVDNLKASAKAGASLAAADQAGEVLIDLLVKLVPSLKDGLEDPMVRTAAKAGMATAVSFLVNATNVPQADKITHVCNNVTTVAAMKASVIPMTMVREELGKLVEFYVEEPVLPKSEKA